MFDRFSTTSPFAIQGGGPTDDGSVADPDMAPTLEDLRGPDLGEAAEDPNEGSVSTTLPVSAREAFEAFCDVEASPRWVSVVKSVKVLARDRSGRPSRAAFLANLERATIGYTLSYVYDEAGRTVTWGTAPGSTTVVVAGRAQFLPLGDQACLLQYQLDLHLPTDALPPWEDPFFSGHAGSVVMNDFRDYIIRRRAH